MSAARLDKATRARHRRVVRKRERGWWMPVVLLLVGFLVLAYPAASSVSNAWYQYRVGQQYTASVAAVDTSAIEKALADAEEYNAGLATSATGLVDPWTSSQTEDEKYREYERYLSLLGADSAMARIRYPSRGIDQPIFHGSSEATLDKGAGHIYGTDLPVGGTSRRPVISAHTGLRGSSFFDNLAQAEVGDVFYIDVYGRVLAYKVTDITVIVPEDTSALVRQEGRDLLTLLTCTPYGVNSHRLLVTGERIPYDAAQAAADAATQGFDPLAGLEQHALWALYGALAALLIALLLWLAHRRRVRRHLRRLAAEAAEAGKAAEAAAPTTGTTPGTAPGTAPDTTGADPLR